MARFSCKDCVPPKRHIGCHATCKQYLEEKKAWEEEKKAIKEHQAKTPRGKHYDMNKVVYSDYLLYKKRRTR